MLTSPIMVTSDVELGLLVAPLHNSLELFRYLSH